VPLRWREADLAAAKNVTARFGVRGRYDGVPGRLRAPDDSRRPCPTAIRSRSVQGNGVTADVGGAARHADRRM